MKTTPEQRAEARKKESSNLLFSAGDLPRFSLQDVLDDLEAAEARVKELERELFLIKNTGLGKLASLT